MVIDESLTIYELVQASGLSLDCAKKTSKMIEKTFINYLQKKSNPTVGDEHSVVNEKEVCQKIMESCDLKRDEESKLRKIVQTCFKNFYFRQKSFEFKVWYFHLTANGELNTEFILVFFLIRNRQSASF